MDLPKIISYECGLEIKMEPRWNEFLERREREIFSEKLSYKKLILRERGSGSRKILEQALFEKNLTLESFRDIIEIGNIAAIKELVKNGTGITFVYKAAVEKELIKGELAKIEIEDFNLKREFNFVYLQNSISSCKCTSPYVTSSTHLICKKLLLFM